MMLIGNLPLLDPPSVLDVQVKAGIIHVCFCPECGWRAYSPHYTVLKIAYTAHDIWCYHRRSLIEVPKKPPARESCVPPRSSVLLMQGAMPRAARLDKPRCA